METPSWLSPFAPEDKDEPRKRPTSKEDGDLMLRQFEIALPRVLEMVCEGKTLDKAIKDYPVTPPIVKGAFLRWLKKRPNDYQLYLDALEIRTEWYVGRMVELAEGDEENPVELDRAKVAIDMYKWLVSRQNKKLYGETKTIEMNTSISITAALGAAQTRVIEAQVIADDDDDLIGGYEQHKALPAPVDDEDA